VNVNIKVTIDERDRRRVRAAVGRGGLATRAEVKVFALSAYRQSLSSAPEPKPKRGTPKVDPVSTGGSRFAAALVADADATCKHCGKAKARHGKMGFACLGVKGTMFEEAK
jgi:hypothetical protein